MRTQSSPKSTADVRIELFNSLVGAALKIEIVRKLRECGREMLYVQERAVIRKVLRLF